MRQHEPEMASAPSACDGALCDRGNVAGATGCVSAAVMAPLTAMASMGGSHVTALARAADPGSVAPPGSCEGRR